jgi:AbrB family looped-hinge helix DNA binding protein
LAPDELIPHIDLLLAFTSEFLPETIITNSMCKGEFMLATVTDKGPVTVPKEVRDRTGIVPGSRIDFEVMDDGIAAAKCGASGADSSQDGT